MTHIPTLQEEVDRKSIEAISNLVSLVEGGLITPSQCDLFLNILQTAFNGIVSDSDICQVMTDISLNLGSFIPLKQSLKISLKKDDIEPVTIEITDSVVTVGDRKIAHETPFEAFNAMKKIVSLLLDKGYSYVK